MMKATLKQLFDANKARIKELIRYGLVGLSTTIINVLTYQGLLFILDYKVANLIALIVSKTYGYFANKKIVFHSQTDSFGAFVLEVLRFVFARGITAIVDYFGLIIAVDFLHYDKVISKYVIQVIVIILNYVLGKYMVFVKKKENKVAEQKVQDYNTGNIEKYQSKNSLKRRMIEQFHQKMLDLIQVMLKDQMTNDSSVKILDAGCGEGFFIARMKEALPQAEIVGCDGAKEALEIAEQMNPDVRFEVANLYELPYEDGQFDLVVCSEVLEHLNDPASALAELCRVGKKVLVTVPNEPWFRLGNLIALHNVMRLGDPIDHINHWTYGAFRRFILSRVSNRECRFDKSFPWSIFWG